MIPVERRLVALIPSAHDLRTRVVAAFLSLALLMAAACDNATSPDENTAEFGHYTLVSVNGQSLPFTITGTASGTVIIQSAAVDLSPATSASGGVPTYSARVSGTANGIGPLQLVTDNGTYSRSGATITFSSAAAPGVQYVGTLGASALTITVPGALFGTTGTLTLVLQR